MGSRVRRLVFAAAALASLVGGVVVGTQAPDPKTLGPSVGQRIREFSLP